MLQCCKCVWKKYWFTSPELEKPSAKPGPSSFDVNVRSVFTFREMGKGYKALSTFAQYMNMPGAITKTRYQAINDILYNAYQVVADESMKNAGKEVYEQLEANATVKDCQVSVDGTWQKRGFSSLNGAVTALFPLTGKCLDLFVLSKVCKGCQMWSKKENHPKYSKWKETHNCHINHTKSSGAMESNGAVMIFQRSIEKHNLRYTGYIGDGDSSSFSDVVKSKPYGDANIAKLECIGHIQKRVGSRCRMLRKSLKGTKLNDGKGISGQGRLTDRAINILQNYYGMAIRQNVGNLYGMKKAVGAVLHHCSDIEDENMRHRFCPATVDSWCKWQSDKITGRGQYKKKLNLPLAIKEVLLPMFKDLSADQLLSKCLHGLTQNGNEALNNLIWKKCPKNIFVNRKVLEISTNSAVISFNDGNVGICKVAERLGLGIGTNMFCESTRVDNARINDMQNKSTLSVKKRRKKLRAIKKGSQDKEDINEKDKFYASGGF